MDLPDGFLSPSEAAARLGISTKALRLYEQRGLLVPLRSAAGWRTYGTAQMARAAEIVALRGLGLSLARIGRVLRGDCADLDPVLAAQEALLAERGRDVAEALRRVRRLRADLAAGGRPRAGDVAGLLAPRPRHRVAFPLPWPWGGERFELDGIRPLTHITGPLGSGKTRLARCLAERLPGAAFVGLDRLADGGAAAEARVAADAALRSRVESALRWLVEDGASESEALLILLTALEGDSHAILVIDMLEQGLDRPTQEALIAWLRRRGPGGRPLLFLTRSSAILDLDAVGPDEAILFCPANHAPPFLVAPRRGASGYEATASCLACPEVRARTAGTIAVRSAV